MRIIGVRSGVSPFVIAVVLLLLISPALAGGQPDAQLAMTQGSPLSGSPVPGTDTTTDTQRPVEVTFTKWRTAADSAAPGSHSAVTLCGHRRRRSRRRRFRRGGSRS